ncbi:MAG: hypothetical protein WAM91_12145 [Candidatus Acidiferrales bacterium]
MRSAAPTPAIGTALLFALALTLFSSGCSTSAKDSVVHAKPAPPPIEFLGAWGAKGVGPGMLSDPRAIAADAFGEVYIVDAGSPSHFIQKFTRDGHPLFSFQPLAPIHNPCASAIDLGGAIYSLECGPGALYIFKPEGDLLRAIRGGLGAPARPSSVTIGNDGRIYIAESHSKRVLRYTSHGSFIGAWGAKVPTPAVQKTSQKGAHQPAHQVVQQPAVQTTGFHADQIASSLDGTLFVCDSDRGWVARISAAGIVEKEWTVPSSIAGQSGAVGRCYLAVTKTSVIVLNGPSFAYVLHIFSYDGQEKLTKPLQDLDPSLVNVTSAGIAAMQDGEIFILDSAVPRVLHFRLNM